jgi:hypothetical protein
MSQISRDFAELFQGGFEVVDGFVGRHARNRDDFISPQRFQDLNGLNVRIERLEPAASL